MVRFGEVIVSAGFQALDYILLGFFGRKKDEIRVSLVSAGADFAARFDAIFLWHNPIEESETRRIIGIQGRDGASAVAYCDDLIRLAQDSSRASCARAYRLLQRVFSCLHFGHVRVNLGQEQFDEVLE
jgi:hypothetical protein